MCYNFAQKWLILNRIIKKFIIKSKNKFYDRYLKVMISFFTTRYYNWVYFRNYKKYLKYSDLTLSISKFTHKIAKRFLKIDSRLWYPGVDSNLLLNLSKPKEIKYDAINISKIVWWKRQEIFVKAAKKLGLKIAIIGEHWDKSIILECPHYEFDDHLRVFKELNKARFYVDCSIFEGFGLTPVEAAFLDKITIASDTYIHREVLRDYPLYFKRDDVEDLVEKMKMVLNGQFKLNKQAVKKIKAKYSLNTSIKNLLHYINSLF
jgi:hypothetical protein